LRAAAREQTMKSTKQNKDSRRARRGTGKAGNSLVSGGKAGVNTMVYEPWMPVFPPSITKTLRYSTTFSLASTSGAITSTQVFRANDLFDPDFTGTGHQPMGFDQLMLWYNHFCVVNAKIRIVAKNTVGSAPTVCLRVDATSTPLTVIDRVVEVGGCITEDLEVKGSYGANKILSISVDIAKLQGVSRSAITADPSLRGDAATSPTEITYFHITMWDTTGTTGGAEFDVILEQTATFMEPRDISESFKSVHGPKQVKPLFDLGSDSDCTCALPTAEEFLDDTVVVLSESKCPPLPSSFSIGLRVQKPDGTLRDPTKAEYADMHTKYLDKISLFARSAPTGVSLPSSS